MHTGILTMIEVYHYYNKIAGAAGDIPKDKERECVYWNSFIFMSFSTEAYYLQL